jgi:enoyl-CoA hydratase/carnithine racemase
MTESSTEFVRISTLDGVTEIAINRPQKKNALTQAMYAAMADAIAAAESDPAVRALLLTGYTPDDASGDGGSPVFTAGNDLADFLTDFRMDASSPVFRFLFSLVRATKPVVAAVDGPAVGVGTTMLLHCDLVYAGRNTRFQLPFINLGLVPEGGSSLLLPLLAGPQRAAELLMLGDPFDAETARSCGMVNCVLESGDVLPAARAAAAALAAKPAEALRTTKRLLRAPQRAALEEVMLAEADAFATALQGPEAAAALQAFFNRRKS